MSDKWKELKKMHISRNIGVLLLAIWLILMGLMELAGLAIPAVVMGLLAIFAGIFILINR
jgi:hypothetical protein